MNDSQKAELARILEGLSLRGTLPRDGGRPREGALAWTRYCQRCALSGPIQSLAQQLAEEHRKNVK